MATGHLHRAGVKQYRKALRVALRGETKAYGFALIIWGNGALAINEHGVPDAAAAIAYIGGALAAMALVLLIAFDGPARPGRGSPSQHIGLGGIHVIAVPVAIAVGWCLSGVIDSSWLAFLASSFGAVTAYQLLLGLEVAMFPTPPVPPDRAEHP